MLGANLVLSSHDGAHKGTLPSACISLEILLTSSCDLPSVITTITFGMPLLVPDSTVNKVSRTCLIAFPETENQQFRFTPPHAFTDSKGKDRDVTSVKNYCVLGAEAAAEGENTCEVHVRPWIPYTAPKQTNKSHNKSHPGVSNDYSELSLGIICLFRS